MTFRVMASGACCMMNSLLNRSFQWLSLIHILGLSSVKLEAIEQRPDVGPVLIVRGADLMDGTPIYDIKHVPV